MNVICTTSSHQTFMRHITRPVTQPIYTGYCSASAMWRDPGQWLRPSTLLVDLDLRSTGVDCKFFISPASLLPPLVHAYILAMNVYRCSTRSTSQFCASCNTTTLVAVLSGMSGARSGLPSPDSHRISTYTTDTRCRSLTTSSSES